MRYNLASDNLPLNTFILCPQKDKYLSTSFSKVFYFLQHNGLNLFFISLLDFSYLRATVHLPKLLFPCSILFSAIYLFSPFVEYISHGISIFNCCYFTRNDHDLKHSEHHDFKIKMSKSLFYNSSLNIFKYYRS